LAASERMWTATARADWMTAGVDPRPHGSLRVDEPWTTLRSDQWAYALSPT